MSSSGSREINELSDKKEKSSVTVFNKNIQGQSLRDFVKNTMESYFHDLDGQIVADVYDMVLQEVEAPLLEVVMKHTDNNQTKASEILGLNRGTLRKKLKHYKLF